MDCSPPRYSLYLKHKTSSESQTADAICYATVQSVIKEQISVTNPQLKINTEADSYIKAAPFPHLLELSLRNLSSRTSACTACMRVETRSQSCKISEFILSQVARRHDHHDAPNGFCQK